MLIIGFVLFLQAFPGASPYMWFNTDKGVFTTLTKGFTYAIHADRRKLTNAIIWHGRIKIVLISFNPAPRDENPFFRASKHVRDWKQSVMTWLHITAPTQTTHHLSNAFVTRPQKCCLAPRSGIRRDFTFQSHLPLFNFPATGHNFRPNCQCCLERCQKWLWP